MIKERDEVDEAIEEATKVSDAASRHVSDLHLLRYRKVREILDLETRMETEQLENWSNVRHKFVRIATLTVLGPWLEVEEYKTYTDEHLASNWPDSCFDEHGNVHREHLKGLNRTDGACTRKAFKAWRVDNEKPPVTANSPYISSASFNS